MSLRDIEFLVVTVMWLFFVAFVWSITNRKR